MKICFIFFLSLLFTSGAFAQDAKIILACNQVIDTLPYLQENRDRSAFYELKELEYLDDEYVFRSWSGWDCIEVVKNGETLSGKVYFAVQCYNDPKQKNKRFAKSYALTPEISTNLYHLVKSYYFLRRPHPSGVNPVVHTFEIKENLNIETYTTDVPQFDYKICDVVPLTYSQEFEKEIPFKDYITWDAICYSKVTGETPYYSSK